MIFCPNLALMFFARAFISADYPHAPKNTKGNAYYNIQDLRINILISGLIIGTSGKHSWQGQDISNKKALAIY
jgi:hypothetical protein